ncbi:MAG: hypothetical protein ACRDL5_06125 [Solirubrobacteraceae bacterium]
MQDPPDPDPDPEPERLWAECRRSGDVRQCDRLVLMLAPIVRRVVFARLGQIPGRRRTDEFLAVGLRALIETVQDGDARRPLMQLAFERVGEAVDRELAAVDSRPPTARQLDSGTTTHEARRGDTACAPSASSTTASSSALA